MAEQMRFRASQTPNAVMVIVLDLDLCSKYLDGMRDAVNIFILSDVTPAAVSSAALVVCCWGAIIGGRVLPYFAEKILLMARQKVASITEWEFAVEYLEAWEVVCAVFLGDASVHPCIYEVLGLLEEATRVGERHRAKYHLQPTFPTALLRLIQTEFNGSFCQTLERHQRVRWPKFDQLRRALARGKFSPDNVALPRLYAPHSPFQTDRGR